MRVSINGKSEEFVGDVSILDVLQSKHVNLEHVIVEHNREIVKRDELAAIQISEGDRLEIVTFVGGG